MRQLLSCVLSGLFIFVIALLLVLASPRATTFIETQIIEASRPVITREDKAGNQAAMKNNWRSVKLLSFCKLVKEFIHPTAVYTGAILVPSLNIDLPLANYTDDDVYTFGADMLVPHSISSNSHFIIGAHNLGQQNSTALFTPLAFNSLPGREIIVTNFKIVKQYQITSKQVISPTNTRAPFQGSANSLSLLTCTSDNQKRILVNARLVRSYPIHDLDDPLQKKLQHKYKIDD